MSLLKLLSRRIAQLPMLCFGIGALLIIYAEWTVTAGFDTGVIGRQITSAALPPSGSKAEKIFSGSRYILTASDEESSAPNDENSLHWDFKNLTGRRVQLRFFSQDRSAVWPGNNQAWNLRDDQVYTYDLSCNASEKICFGAWYYDGTSRHWGAGFRGDEACTKCCATCGGSPEQVDLVP